MLVGACSALGFLSMCLVDYLEIIFRIYWSSPKPLLLVEICLEYLNLLVLLYKSFMTRQLNFLKPSYYKASWKLFSRLSCIPLLKLGICT